jgi:ATP-dependent DNA helicase RecQ
MTKNKADKTIDKKTVTKRKKNKKETFPKEYEKLYIEEKIPFLILKCISSMTDFDQRHYGRKRICDILKGTCSKFVLENGHHHNPCYGALKVLLRRQIYYYIDELIKLGALLVDDEIFPTLEITNKGKQLLKLKKKVKVALPFNLDPEPIPTFDYEMYSHLCDIRLVQAKDEGIPPYCVLPNNTIVELCIRSPKETEDLDDIRGFGPARTQKYGELFIKAIEDYSAYKINQ